MGATAERLLVAGATGYIGRKLAGRLAEGGVDVRCLARTPEKARDLKEKGCEIVAGDVLDPGSLAPAMERVDLAYYLVHSMGRGATGDFEETDRQAATNFAEAAQAAGIKRIVYLGGLGDESKSKHLRSRQETAEALQSTGLPMTYLRAAVVVGGGSESFQTIYYLVRRLPAMVTPKWTTIRTQPIGAEDVVSYLAAAKDLSDENADRTIEIGGPDITTYGGMMDEVAKAMARRPPLRVAVPLLSPSLSSRWIGLVTPVDTGVARPLVEGLSTETVVKDHSGMELFEIDPGGLSEAMRAAVRELESM